MLPTILRDVIECQNVAGFPIECLVVDGGSEDDSTKICKDFNIRVIEAPCGRGSQLAVGAKHAHGDILLFVHADSYLTIQHCLTAVQTIQNNGIAAGGFRLEFDDRHPILRLAEFLNLIRFRFTKIIYGDHGIFIRRDRYDAAGGFSPQPLFEDIEFSRRLRKLGAMVLTSPPLRTSARRFRRGGVIRTYLLMAMLYVMYWLKVSPERLARLYSRDS